MQQICPNFIFTSSETNQIAITNYNQVSTVTNKTTKYVCNQQDGAEFVFGNE